MNADKLDPARCSAAKYQGFGYSRKQCSHPIKVTRDGRGYCGTHDPEARKARNDARYAITTARWEVQARYRDFVAACHEACTKAGATLEDFRAGRVHVTVDKPESQP
jgi:hypothetical protein